MRFELFVGSEAFWNAARADIAVARHRVLIQAMTFEGDAAGLAVADAIGAAKAADRRVLVDDYTRHNLNDTLLAFSRDSALQAEARATWAMFATMAAQGVGVRVTNPVGRNPLRYVRRNHKKLLVMDDAVWIGGINFSDHNFAWHDMMLRIDDTAIADAMARQFDCDWQGVPGPERVQLPGFDLLNLDGVGNAARLAPLLDRLASARRSIEVVSAYPSFPFVDAMAAAARRGVPVTLYVPGPNNKPVMRDYLFAAHGKGPIQVRLLPEMTHVKAALIDGEALVLGSCNFDFVAYRANAEYIAVLDDPALIAQFESALLGPAREAGVRPNAARPGWRARLAPMALKIADALIAAVPPGKRIAEWAAP